MAPAVAGTAVGTLRTAITRAGRAGRARAIAAPGTPATTHSNDQTNGNVDATEQVWGDSLFESRDGRIQCFHSVSFLFGVSVVGSSHYTLVQQEI